MQFLSLILIFISFIEDNQDIGFFVLIAKSYLYYDLMGLYVLLISCICGDAQDKIYLVFCVVEVRFIRRILSHRGFLSFFCLFRGIFVKGALLGFKVIISSFGLLWAYTPT